MGMKDKHLGSELASGQMVAGATYPPWEISRVGTAMARQVEEAWDARPKKKGRGTTCAVLLSLVQVSWPPIYKRERLWDIESVARRGSQTSSSLSRNMGVRSLLPLYPYLSLLLAR